MSIRGKMRTLRSKNLEEVWEIAAQRYYAHLVKRRSPALVTVDGRKWPVHHRKSFSDVMAIWQCFHKKQYSMPVHFFGARHHSDLMSRLRDRIVADRKTPLIVDCGANIGASAVWFSAKYPGAKVVALEPEPGNASVLSRNAEKLGVSVLQAGIGPEDGTAVIHDTGTGGMGFQTRASDASGNVPILSLASVIRDYPPEQFVPFILKLDVEGAERNLFDGDVAAFDSFPLIIIELHDFMMPGEGTSHGFFRYHARRSRDFIYHMENVFSFDERRLSAGSGRA